MDKRKVTLSVIAIAVLLVVLVGSTYAYWTLNGPAQTSANVQVQTGGLILRLDDTEGSITTNDVIDPNHLSFSKYFNITNESAADGYAKVLFKGLTNTFVTDALVYDLEEVQANKTSFATPRMIITNQVLPKSVVSSNATLADGLLVEKGTISGNTVTPNTKYYKLTVRYKYSDTVNQNDDLDKTLISGFTIEEGQSSVSMTVSFNTNDTNIAAPSNITVTMDSTYENLPILTKTNYRLEGWYSDSEFTERITNNSKVSKNSNHTLYAKWKESKFECLDESGNEIICPSPLIVGTRIALRDTENVQTFRYIRTTDISDSTHTYNECNNGGSSSIACTDADSRNTLKNNQLRLLAEYSINVGTNKNPSILNGIQHESIRGWRADGKTKYGNIKYSESNNNYSTSNLKIYSEAYANILNGKYFENNNIIIGSALTFEELVMLGCDRNTGSQACNNAYFWVSNCSYWIGSPANSINVWVSGTDKNFGNINYDYVYDNSIRPIIMIDKDLV